MHLVPSTITLITFTNGIIATVTTLDFVVVLVKITGTGFVVYGRLSVTVNRKRAIQNAVISLVLLLFIVSEKKNKIKVRCRYPRCAG